MRSPKLPRPQHPHRDDAVVRAGVDALEQRPERRVIFRLRACDPDDKVLLVLKHEEVLQVRGTLPVPFAGGPNVVAREGL